MQRTLLFSFLLLVLATSREAAKQASSDIRQYDKEGERTSVVPAGQTQELCLTLPRGEEKVVGSDRYVYWYHRPNVAVYGKKIGEKGWGKPCRPTGEDFMICDGATGAGFMGSTFELEAATPFSQNVCWSFVNRSKASMRAKILVHYLLGETKNTFVTFRLDPNDQSPLPTSVVSSCLCMNSNDSVTAYFGSMLGPDTRFYARRGDVVEIKAGGEGNKNGLPVHCEHELSSGVYHVRIEHIRAFEQPAVYKAFVIGTLTSEPVTDKRAFVRDYFEQQKAH